jgi:hypothetical protein
MSWNRILSGLIAISYIVLAFFADGAKGAFIFGAVRDPASRVHLVFRSNGRLHRPGMARSITHSTPGLAVCVAGWLLLLLPGVGVNYGLNRPKS